MLNNCVLSVGGDSEQLSRDSIEFQELVCVCAFSAPPRSVGKEENKPTAANQASYGTKP